MPDGPLADLGSIRQKRGKIVHAWAVEGDCDPALLRSNTFALKGKTYPEVDRGGWFGVQEAKRKILPGQAGFLEELPGLL